MRKKPSFVRGRAMFLPSADLAAPERRVIGREIPIRRAKGALQLDGVALRERRHGLQPERRRLGGVRP